MWQLQPTLKFSLSITHQADRLSGGKMSYSAETADIIHARLKEFKTDLRL